MDDLEACVARTAERLTHLNTLAPTLVRIRLFDPFAEPMPRARFRVTVGERTLEGRADDAAWLEFRALDVPETCTVEWDDDAAAEVVVDDPNPPARATADTPAGEYIDPAWVFDGSFDRPGGATGDGEFRYKHEVYLRLEAQDEQQAAYRRLHNIGFTLGETLAEHIREFERAYARKARGELDGVKGTLWDWHDTGGLSRCTKPEPPGLA